MMLATAAVLRPTGEAWAPSRARNAMPPPEMPQSDTPLGGILGLAQPAHGGGGVGVLRTLLRAATRPLTAPSRWLSARLCARRAAVSWAAVNAILEDEVLPAVRAAFPTTVPFCTKFADDGPPSHRVPLVAADGTRVGDVAVLKGAPVDWMCMARMWLRARGFGYARLDVFLDGSTNAPHLQLHITVFPTGAYNIYFDCQPRCDLVLHDDYLRRVYLTPPPGCPRALAEIVADCLRQPDAFTPFISRDGATRVFMASPAMMHMIISPGRKGTAHVRGLAREMTAAWLALAAAPDAERAVLDGEAQRRRDIAIREFIRRDPDKNLVPVLGEACTDMLLELLTAGAQASGT